ncbi:hypothetical protein PROFUN_04881 [Planoprotostelium fungivorum]|uniref:NAD/GMP synthase domain-containing protein n=1 Tax=Planoprotostelium fungivorum TaxID=1890364 RepID=A0A2P6NF32_9EUKA|nr:hypothetical protein PROFUN_04881 [Planoprotostelium fungivorum]
MPAVTIHDELKKELQEIRTKKNFVAKEWADKKAAILNDYCRKHGLKATVVSVSGGVDSSVILALCHHAMSLEGSPIQKVMGIAQPIHSTEKIWKRALELQHHFPKSEIITVDQTPVFDLLKPLVDQSVGVKGGDFASGQLRSYMRTPVGFYAAQLLSQNGTPAIVVGTGNKDEDGYLFYFCKAGDGVADIQLIADLHKSEVFAVGRVLNVPQSVLEAAPSADLWADQSDEDELGFPYDFVELWTTYLEYPEGERKRVRDSFSEEARKQFDELGEKAALVHRRNSHKEHYPLNL